MNELIRIDVHHHAFPPALQAAKAANSGALGWKMTAEGRHWSPEVSLGSMGKLKIDKAILSLPPGYPPEQKDVRAANQELKKMHDQYPKRFGFWAALGDLRNTKGTHVFPPELSNCFEGSGVSASVCHTVVNVIYHPV
jgi:hypothetical protein